MNGEKKDKREMRIMRIMINKAGGNAGKNALNYRMSIPSVWAKTLGITEKNREVVAYFDGETLTIKKRK